MSTVFIVLAITSFVAATVNGALGYGYSSISVPVALLVIASRVLNPALVVIEVIINLYSVFWNRQAARDIAHRVVPLVIGLVPGVIVGSLLLGVVAASSVKLVAYGVLLPLIVLQASGRRWPIKREKSAAVPLGAAVGVLYGLTTISGPPLALFWNNQGLAKHEFKLGLAIVRSVESVCALLAYAWLGLVTMESVKILPVIAPGVLLGFPFGHWLLRRVGSETFRRVCMSFDAYLVAFGLAHVLIGTAGVAPIFAYQLMTVTALVDTPLLYLYFRARGSRPAQAVFAAVPVNADA